MAEPLLDSLSKGMEETQRPELVVLPEIGVLIGGSALATVTEAISLPDTDDLGVGHSSDYMPPRSAGDRWTTADDIRLKARTGRTRQRWL